MNEQIIKLETAKLLKEKGFDIKCMNGYHEGFGELENDSYPSLGTYSFIPNCNCDNKKEYQIVAPTFSLIQKWLREKFDIDIIIYRSFSMDKSYHYTIIKNCDYDNEIQQVCIPNRAYEQSLEDAIFKSLQMLP